MVSKYLIFTNPQKILKFLFMHSDKPCYEREIARQSKINYVLNQFYKGGLVQRKSERRRYSYSNKVANRKIQVVITTPTDILHREERQKVFMEQVEQGTILWERGINKDDL